jgi:aspartate/methionine/tyrosine aminotransferase
MRAPIGYLDWAIRFYGRVAWDLATSGILTLPSEELFALAPDAVPRPDDHEQIARFRALVAQRYGVPEDDVHPALGASGGIFLAYAALLEPGDDVLVEHPTYEPIPAVAAGLGARVRTFERPVTSSFALDVDAVLAAVRPETRMVALTNPHNPGGVYLDDAIVAPLARELEARGVVLVIDEVYREFTAPSTTAYRLAPNICISASLTKCFGLGWARAGWAVLPPRLADQARAVLRHTVGVPPPWQAGLGAFALTHVEHLSARTARLQDGKLAHVAAFAERHRDRLSWVSPPAHMPFSFFSSRLERDLLPKIEAGIAKEGVIVAPGTFFGCPAGMRLAITAPVDRVIEGLARLVRALGLLPSPT